MINQHDTPTPADPVSGADGLPDGVAQFTKKPVTISAIQWTGGNLKEVIAFTGMHPRFHEWFSCWDEYVEHVGMSGGIFKIFTLEGVMEATPGDWIIRGVKGEHYPCKPDIFAATYNVAPPQPSGNAGELPDAVEHYGTVDDPATQPGAQPEASNDWAIDHSAGRPILIYKRCSVIEAEDAEYVMGLIRADRATQSQPPVSQPIKGSLTVDEREAFEFWASDEGEHPTGVERDGNGNYKLAQIQSHWEAWQARAALAQQASDYENGRHHGWAAGWDEAMSQQASGQDRPLIARQLADWHEDDGPVAWWAWCGHEWAGEPAWVGTPLDSDWPGYHTHWTAHPTIPLFGARAAAKGDV